MGPQEGCCTLLPMLTSLSLELPFLFPKSPSLHFSFLNYGPAINREDPALHQEDDVSLTYTLVDCDSGHRELSVTDSLSS